ncbi:unnamed protein product [Medioppia subpectinata]|uniref:Uncharacterized protein n=1 Tax=Medioppia subpectinata TaxID=1979941 RepID=A0A7R9Q5B8_9ACAR|nr:unnamed protein product [Medioppia subpectinata]CAG2113591.1 unnamed protein product [Medioppia subpectinata]
MTKEEKAKYPVKHVKITTCGQLYERWKENKPLYERAPKNGLTLDVEYADNLSLLNWDSDSCDTKLMVCLHGAPGSHSDFEAVIQHMTRLGVRVIAPNFPDYSVTIKTDIFRHSAEEKTEFIKDFLRAIGINRIDVMIAHSSAIYPTTMLWCDQKGPRIESFVLLNPGGHRRIKAMRPVWYTEGGVKVYQNKWGRTLFQIFGTAFLNITKTVTVKADNMNNVILSASTMRYSRFKQLEEKLIKLRESKIPVLLVFSENDRLIEKEIFYEMAEILGANEDNISIYDENGCLEKDGSVDDTIKVVSFRSGGHYCFLKYTNVVNKACDQLLRTLDNKLIQNEVICDTN